MADSELTDATDQAAAPKLDPESVKKLVDSRQRLHATLAQVVLAMMSAPRYKHCSIGELEHLVVDPLLRDRIAVATATPKKDAEPGINDGQLVGVAIWAKVSPEVDVKIREQIKAGVFPVRLKPDDWNSGDIVWLLDVIAASRQQATAVLANIRQVVKKGNLLVHPILSNLVDSEWLQKAAAARQPSQS
ncbi:toxin-activating lysine-acyltransferase [Rhodoblastus acidophilus]|nr:toxin-activating lysine-acyltransferase [Rhodoblastus acidophilus]PPQ34732.1 toxin-activating lysine-acyltransferase [Rhodoblastus acidophilus]RAI16461.1 toxin-activating lysine-acyltransferase [Rhodoblastus acidophilus]